MVAGIFSFFIQKIIEPLELEVKDEDLKSQSFASLNKRQEDIKVDLVAEDSKLGVVIQIIYLLGFLGFIVGLFAVIATDNIELFASLLRPIAPLFIFFIGTFESANIYRMLLGFLITFVIFGGFIVGIMGILKILPKLPRKEVIFFFTYKEGSNDGNLIISAMQSLGLHEDIPFLGVELKIYPDYLNMSSFSIRGRTYHVERVVKAIASFLDRNLKYNPKMDENVEDREWHQKDGIFSTLPVKTGSNRLKGNYIEWIVLISLFYFIFMFKMFLDSTDPYYLFIPLFFGQKIFNFLRYSIFYRKILIEHPEAEISYFSDFLQLELRQKLDFTDHPKFECLYWKDGIRFQWQDRSKNIPDKHFFLQMLVPRSKYQQLLEHVSLRINSIRIPTPELYGSLWEDIDNEKELEKDDDVKLEEFEGKTAHKSLPLKGIKGLWNGFIVIAPSLLMIIIMAISFSSDPSSYGELAMSYESDGSTVIAYTAPENSRYMFVITVENETGYYFEFMYNYSINGERVKDYDRHWGNGDSHISTMNELYLLNQGDIFQLNYTGPYQMRFTIYIDYPFPGETLFPVIIFLALAMAPIFIIVRKGFYAHSKDYSMVPDTVGEFYNTGLDHSHKRSLPWPLLILIDAVIQVMFIVFVLLFSDNVDEFINIPLYHYGSYYIFNFMMILLALNSFRLFVLRNFIIRDEAYRYVIIYAVIITLIQQLLVHNGISILFKEMYLHILGWFT
ncbi:MAG: hypothetical protein INQ03_08275 [Candidatus Heimdallarchaeota archaeon]|nr:hypothetical protein [Candidatus Heimdallarchaeota archaeon]